MSRKVDLAVAVPRLSAEEAEQVRAQLDRVLNSHLFRSSRRCQSLLRYITEQTLSGNTNALKERTLGIDVFDRAPDYDTSQDPVVRATAAEIRKKLAQYYQENSNQSELRIDLLPGSYVVELHPPAPPEAVPQRRGRPLAFTMIAAAVATAAICAAIFVPDWGRSALDEFWAPLLRAPQAVLICVGQPVAYNLVSAQAQDDLQKEQQSQDGTPPVLTGTIARKDLIVLWDRYVALGDAICMVRLTSLFEHYAKEYRIRGERSISYADLKENPVVLIAAFDNQWTLQAAGQLRFTFAKDSAHETEMVRDRLQPGNTQWKLTAAWPHWDVAEDFAIISRIRDINTDRPLVIAAGITQYGTLAAGEFLSNREALSEAVRNLPRDWHRKNLQIVLRVPVLHRTPGHPRVVATHLW